MGPDAIERGEDRLAFKETMTRLGIEMPRSEICYTVDEAAAVAAELGYPVVIRPAYTMGGTGGGLVYNVEELQVIVARGHPGQPGRPGAGGGVGARLGGAGARGRPRRQEPDDHRLLHRERRRHGRAHRRQLLHRPDAHHRARAAGEAAEATPTPSSRPSRSSAARTSSSPTTPRTGRVVVIEINPRTSRSSALASKATGFPIAMVSSLLAGGLTLDEIPYWRDGTLEKYTPSGDYVVVKFARWAFEKFRGAEDKLGTQMRAVGEVMSIGKNYKEALQKAIRSLETGRHGLGFAKDFNARSLDELLAMLTEPTSERQFIMYEALRKGATTEAALRPHPHQALVHRADAGAGGAGGGDPRYRRPRAPRRQSGGRCRPRRPPCSPDELLDARPRRTASPTPTWPSSSACPRRASASSG